MRTCRNQHRKVEELVYEKQLVLETKADKRRHGPRAIDFGKNRNRCTLKVSTHESRETVTELVKTKPTVSNELGHLAPMERAVEKGG